MHVPQPKSRLFLMGIAFILGGVVPCGAHVTTNTAWQDSIHKFAVIHGQHSA